MDLFRLDGKHIVITGASSGFGHHFAGVLSAAGARVSLGARRVDRVAARVADIRASGAEATGIALDVRSADSIRQFLDAAEAAYGPIDVVINNAGVEAGAKTYLMIDEADWDYVMETNLKGPWLMSKLYTERFLAHRQSHGNIINISSITDTRTIKGQFPYAVSKGALTRMTEVLALEAARYGIRVNALAPGYIHTDVSHLVFESENAADFMKGIPMRRFGEFDDLDGPILLLASDASRYMTGSVIVVDGGHICASL
ncbi:MAG: SDR family NAD(P)-dependent oxidoreductase [Pseudomonadales bacterium]